MFDQNSLKMEEEREKVREGRVGRRKEEGEEGREGVGEEELATPPCKM